MGMGCRKGWEWKQAIAKGTLTLQQQVECVQNGYWLRNGAPAGMLPQWRSKFAKKRIEEHTDVKFAYLHLNPLLSPTVLDRISFHRLVDDRKKWIWARREGWEGWPSKACFKSLSEPCHTDNYCGVRIESTFQQNFQWQNEKK